MGKGRKTAFEYLRGMRSRRALPEFGETVMYRPLRNADERDDTRAYIGCFIGLRERSDEVVLADGEGVIRARDFRRLPPHEQWQPELLMKLRATTWQPSSGPTH